MKSIRLTGLWQHTDEKGEKYMSAKVGANYFNVRKNSYKKSDKEPDFYLYISQPDFDRNKEENQDILD